MIIADRLEVIDAEGNTLTGSEGNVVYTREQQDSAYKSLVIQGIDSIYANIKLDVQGDKLVIVKEEDENAPAQSAYIGDRFGVAEGTSVKLQVIFLDGKFFITIMQGFINIGVEDEFIYESYLTPNDERILASDKKLITEWITVDHLLGTVDAVTKDKYKTVETMFEIEITHKGAVSYKTLNKFDLSNGRIEEMERQEKEAKEAEERRRKERLEAQRQRKIEMEQKAELRERQEVAVKNIEVKNMFDRLLNRNA